MNSSIWERFQKNVRQIFHYAQEEAKRLNSNYICGEHLLIGMLREETGVAGQVLRELGLETSRVRTVVERLTTVNNDSKRYNKIELAPSTKRMLENAIEEAGRMSQYFVSTEHFLLGMVGQSDSKAVEVLRKLGVTQEHIRRQIRRIMKERFESETPSILPRSKSRPRRSLDRYSPMSFQAVDGLPAYQLAGKVADVVWEVVSNWETFEQESIGLQFVQAADSIGANIAESGGRAPLINGVSGSLYKTRYWLIRAQKRNLVDAKIFDKLIDELSSLQTMVNAID